MPVRAIGSSPLPPTTPAAGAGSLDAVLQSGAVLKRGASGPAVRELQEKLNALGFDSGAADGKFGPRTERAVIAYQRSRGAAVLGAADGKAGPRTLGALLGGAGPTTPTPRVPGDSFEGGETKLRRMKDSEVTPALTAKAVEILKQYGRAENYGMEIPFELDGKRYAARIEKHYHPPGGPIRPWGEHPGVSLFAVEAAR